MISPLARRMANRPLLLSPSHVGSLFEPQAVDPSILKGDVVSKDGYEVIADVAVIDITGFLCQSSGLLPAGKSADSWYWFYYMGYQDIGAALELALADPAVKAVALAIDSGGGEVAGCFDLVDMIFAARGAKPIWAILNEAAYSAAYAIASACDHITVPRTGGTGSIGVIAVHVDFSQMLATEGVKYTVLTYGDRKADGHPAMPLSKEAAKGFQADLDLMGELFVSTVARNRGVTPDKIRDTQAATFLGALGVESGFADEVLAPLDALYKLAAMVNAA